MCVPCPNFCKVCEGKSKNNCKECLKGFNRELRDGHCEDCKEGYANTVDDSNICILEKYIPIDCDEDQYEKNNKCYPCHNSCKTCTGPNEDECESCDSDRNLEFDNGECECSEGYIEAVLDESDTEWEEPEDQFEYTFKADRYLGGCV